MKKIVLLMCAKHKLDHKAKVRNLYISSRFQKSIEYAGTLSEDKNIFVLSAKHGLLSLDIEIEPYDKSIYKMSIEEKQAWTSKVVSQLTEVSDINNDTYIFLTDDFYADSLLPFLKNVQLPLEKLDQNQHLGWYNAQLEGK
jgi:hypothetical protein